MAKLQRREDSKINNESEDLGIKLCDEVFSPGKVDLSVLINKTLKKLPPGNEASNDESAKKTAINSVINSVKSLTK